METPLKKKISDPIKQTGECVASNEVINLISDLKVASNHQPIAQSESALTEYQQSLLYTGKIAFQVTPHLCHKQSSDQTNSIIQNTDNIGKIKSGKCWLLDKTRSITQQLRNRNAIEIKENGQLKSIQVTKHHQQGFDDTIKVMTDLKRKYQCNSE